MRTAWPAALLALAAGCASSLTAQERSARDAFQAWRQAILAGDGPRTVGMMSDEFKSEWIFRLLLQGDPAVHEWRAALTGTARTDLDLWYEHERRRRADRPGRLYPSVLVHPSFAALCLRLFEEDREALQFQFERLQILNVYGDDAAVSVTVQNFAGRTEIYELAPAPGGWKVNGHREPLGNVPR